MKEEGPAAAEEGPAAPKNWSKDMYYLKCCSEASRSLLEVFGFNAKRDPCCSKYLKQGCLWLEVLLEAMICVIWSIRTSWSRKALPTQRRAPPRPIIEARICITWRIAPKRFEVYLMSFDSIAREILTAPTTWSKDMWDECPVAAEKGPAAFNNWNKDNAAEEGPAAAEEGLAVLNNWSEDMYYLKHYFEASRSILEVLGCHGRRDPCCFKYLKQGYVDFEVSGFHQGGGPCHRRGGPCRPQ